MELSENPKLRLDLPTAENHNDRGARGGEDTSVADTGLIDEAESQMRKALGLIGEASRHRLEPERTEQSNRTGNGERFNGGLHRRRFVQDGDVPVTVLRREQGLELPTHRGAAVAATPTSSRLQRIESALAAETSAREKAERSLAESQALARDLQTKIGHADLAKNEAIDALRREREASVQVRAEVQALTEQLREAVAEARSSMEASALCHDQLSDERQARKVAEKALRASEAAREAAEQLVRTLSEETQPPYESAPSRQPRAEPEVMAATARMQHDVQGLAEEPEPVKWWLNTKPTSKRR